MAKTGPVGAFKVLDCFSPRMRFPMISRWNGANDSRMFSVSRPIDVVVLNCWVTETKS